MWSLGLWSLGERRSGHRHVGRDDHLGTQGEEGICAPRGEASGQTSLGAAWTSASQFHPSWTSDPQPPPCLDLGPPASALPGSQTPSLGSAWISDPQSRPCLDLRPSASALSGPQTHGLQDKEKECLLPKAPRAMHLSRDTQEISVVTDVATGFPGDAAQGPAACSHFASSFL